ncbi:F0F1 ATP synthase subunit A [Caloramator sp. ALD01]|uniref:F0F1 ATP synthase subunit A n=1 Tax=Caloramator sp. ALD01 TaxID=1031288 RepID=UPI0004281AC0|nr:F0F1 ATP synthase subunit A [Caloramator sp. ALD01]
MGKSEAIFTLRLLGLNIPIYFSVIAQWIVIAFIMLIVPFLVRDLKTVPRGKQIFVETVVEKINSLVKGSMGDEYKGFAPFFGTLMIYLLFLNLFGLTGFRPPTADYSVALGLALISFVLIQVNAIVHSGILGYFKGYAKPFWFMLPLNIIERLVVPVSLSLRLFGNITAAVIMMELLYEGLEFLSYSLHLKVPVFAAFLPIPFHIYFDLFDGTIQMFIFVMLTMIFIKTTSEH